MPMTVATEASSVSVLIGNRMPTASSYITFERALRRLEVLGERLRGFAATADPGELDWAPDEGISAMRDHVVVLVASIRVLNRRISPGRFVDGPELAEVGAEELLRSLIGGHESCRRRLSKLREVEEPLPSSFLDALDDHCELVAQSLGAISLLRQLIDPRRPATI
jgi:hypothetical protein